MVALPGSSGHRPAIKSATVPDIGCLGDMAGMYMGFAFLPIALGYFASGWVGRFLRAHTLGQAPLMWFGLAGLGLIAAGGIYVLTELLSPRPAMTQAKAKVEQDIAQMAAEEQREFIASLGLKEPARDRFVRAAFALLDLISFLTAGEDECRAWPIHRGTRAQRAAGKVHSDIERGFIRAEVARWEDLVALKSEAHCREAGKLRLEGKEYEVHDGDVINFRFNV
jgi:hypothetical protein